LLLGTGGQSSAAALERRAFWYYTSSNQCELHSTSPVNAIAQNSEFHLSTCLPRLRLQPVADTEPFARAQFPAFLGFDLAWSVLTPYRQLSLSPAVTDEEKRVKLP
jgi:hypothetical protein